MKTARIQAGCEATSALLVKAQLVAVRQLTTRSSIVRIPEDIS
jgi:hypothetical protein